MTTFTETQLKSLAITPKITAAFSIFGTLYVIRNVVTSRKKRQLVYHRILLSISIVDLIIGTMMFLSTWPIPRGTQGVYGAVGTTQTCTFQGFFLQLAIMAPLYNAALSLYYLLIVRYNWSEERLKRLKWPIHGTIITFGLGTAIAGLPLTLFNNANIWCWQAPLPWGCVESRQSGESTTCIRGDNATSVYRWAFFYAPLWAAILFATIAMILVYSTVRHYEKKSDRYAMASYSCNQQQQPLGNDGKTTTRTESSSSSSLSLRKRQQLSFRQGRHAGKRTRKVARQALCYVGAFYFTWIWSTLTRLLQSTSASTPYALVLLTAIFLPFQGFLNFVVYIRPRYERYRERGTARLKAIQQVARESVTSMAVHVPDSRNGDESNDDDYNVALTEAQVAAMAQEEEEEQVRIRAAATPTTTNHND